MKENKKEKAFIQKSTQGITLVSLVITIIILLILAGVAINLAVDSDGLFSKAGEAANKWNIATGAEHTQLTNLIGIAGVTGGGSGSGGSGGSSGGSGEGDEVATPTWDFTRVTQYPANPAEGERVAPIPNGYAVSGVPNENTIAGGLVIYKTDGAEENDANFWTATSNDYLTCQQDYDQFVWIPVSDINSMIMCQSNNKLPETGDASKICNIDWVDVVDEEAGKTVKKLQCTNPAHISTADKLCGRLYGVDNIEEDAASSASGKNVYKATMDFTLETQTYEPNSGYREPAVVTGSDGTKYDAASNNYHGFGAGTEGANDFLDQLQKDFNAMAESVKTYGGFYIGRYEAGYASSGYTSTKNNVVMNATTDENKGVNMWYGLYSHLKGTKGELNSYMIWGCQYDQVINFIGTEAEIGHYDRSLYGSYDAGTLSGVTALDNMKNIFDLEGNYYEWTAQAGNTYSRDCRGGGCGFVAYGYFLPASYRNTNYPNYTYGNYSSRPGLYL